jgi:hypothetical protein
VPHTALCRHSFHPGFVATRGASVRADGDTLGRQQLAYRTSSHGREILGAVWIRVDVASGLRDVFGSPAERADFAKLQYPDDFGMCIFSPRVGVIAFELNFNGGFSKTA